MLASDFLTTHGVSVKWSNKGVEISPDKWEHTRWTVYVTNDMGRTEHFPYRTGMAHKAPTAAGVLYSLASDCRVFEDSGNPHDVMSEFGMTDYRAAEKLFDACNRTNTILYDWCSSPDMFTDLLSIEDE